MNEPDDIDAIGNWIKKIIQAAFVALLLWFVYYKFFQKSDTSLSQAFSKTIAQQKKALLSPVNKTSEVLMQGLSNQASLSDSDTSTFRLVITGLDDINFKTDNGETALILLFKSQLFALDHPEFIHLVLNRNPNLNESDSGGNTALMWTSMRKNSALANMLLSKEAAKNLKNEYGNTALILASNYGSLPCVELLLKYGADASIRNKAGQNASDVAKTPEIKSLLMKVQ